MGRKAIYSISDEAFTRFLRKHFIDEEGNKISIRELFSSDLLYDYTGYYRLSPTGNREMVSMGSISKLLPKLRCSEQELFTYYKRKKLISEEITFEMWSKRCNRKHTKNSKPKREDFKAYMIEFFKLDYVECYDLSMEDLRMKALMNYLNLDLSIEEFEEDFKSLQMAIGVSNRDLNEGRLR